MAYNTRLNEALELGKKQQTTIPMFDMCFEGMQGAGLTSVCLKWVNRLKTKRITGLKREITYI